MFHISATFDNDLYHQFICTRAKINIQSASVMPESIRNIEFSFHFFFVWWLHKLQQFFFLFLFKLIYILSDTFLSLQLLSSKLAPVLTYPRMPFGRERTALYPFIYLISWASAVPICCGTPINNVWQRCARDNPWPANFDLSAKRNSTQKNKQVPLTQGRNLIWCRKVETRLSFSDSFGGTHSSSEHFHEPWQKQAWKKEIKHWQRI